MLAEVGAVAGLGGQVGDGLVAPRTSQYLLGERNLARRCHGSSRQMSMSSNLLAGRLGAADVGLGKGLGGLGRVLDGLGEDGKTALLSGDDTDGLAFQFSIRSDEIR